MLGLILIVFYFYLVNYFYCVRNCWTISMTENNWKLVDAFFDKYDLVDHHIKSYNDFVNNRIQNIIDITEPITLDDGKYTLKTGKSVLKSHQTKKLMVLVVKLIRLKLDLET